MRGVFAAAAACLLIAATNAPFQCASDPDTTRRSEDTAPEALWALAERFRREGNEPARRTTLEHLREEYPSSRYARRAALVLEDEEDAQEEVEEAEGD